ncbi:hypothetical protein [Robertkochia sediminum]|uniref:hypothetical protein n=1 Tax=Robertkochia sediminum TaxID=2785326 RepID=UPI001931FAD0|nr:hypothetical protein [Robertkochia sediminum]MBL7471665.1 hypothetical protein [Robertkochia sediminum]
MKKYRYALIIAIVLLAGFSLAGCGNSHWGTSAGVDVVWGPGGPRVQPNISVGVYNGGRW